MLESEAVIKTCHLSMAGTNPKNCLGSLCMAWMWNAPPPPTQRFVPEDDPEDVDGYCVTLHGSEMMTAASTITPFR